MFRRLLLYFARATAIILLLGMQAAHAASVSGVITDGYSNAPLQGTEVYVKAGNSVVKKAVSDKNGAYAIDGITAGTYTFGALDAGHEPVEKTISLQAEEQSIGARATHYTIVKDVALL